MATGAAVSSSTALMARGEFRKRDVTVRHLLVGDLKDHQDAFLAPIVASGAPRGHPQGLEAAPARLRRDDKGGTSGR
jgi:hypothetical protein